MRKNKKLIRVIAFALTVFLLVGSNQPIVKAKEATKENTERNAMWISYVDMKISKKSKTQFTNMMIRMMDKCKKNKMNTVVVQVRPNGDALYPSKYFPWSNVVSGKQGRKVSYDPLKIVVEQAHKRGLKVEAWINPYRIAGMSTNVNKLAKSNQARKWAKKKSTKRNVLKYNGGLYYNPSKAAVRRLIINGVKEIVKNYDIDGIHMDDYFYPTFSKSNVKKAFDAKEYRSYVKKQKKNGVKAKSIANWRRSNVNKLVKGIYSAVKKINSDVEFGISPAGNIDNLTHSRMYYVDIYRWLSTPGYVDYICPQIYWGYKNGNESYKKVLNRWIKANKKQIVKLYVGLGVYRVQYPYTKEWKKSTTVLKRQILDARKTKAVDGYYYYCYSTFNCGTNRAKKSIKNMVKVIK